MKKHSLMAILIGALVLPIVVSCTKPDDGGSGNTDDPETPITPIDPINPVDPNTPEDIWGVYNPGKKIKKVYESSSTQAKYLREAWHWNIDLLEEIDHYNSEGSLVYRKKFTYENNRLNRIETVDFYENIEDYKTFDYENNQLKRVNFYGTNDIFKGSTSLVYENGKLSEMKYYSAGTKYSENRTFVWDGNNVKEITFINMFGSFSNSIKICPEYDHNVNIMKGFLDWEMDFLGLFSVLLYSSDLTLSNNNMVKARMWINGATSTDYDYILQYQYDGDGYPIQINIGDKVVFYEYE